MWILEIKKKKKGESFPLFNLKKKKVQKFPGKLIWKRMKWKANAEKLENEKLPLLFWLELEAESSRVPM